MVALDGDTQGTESAVSGRLARGRGEGVERLGSPGPETLGLCDRLEGERGTRLTPSSARPPRSLRPRSATARRAVRRHQRGFRRCQRDIEVAARMLTVDAQRAGEPDRDFDRADEVLDCPRVGVALLEGARIGQFLSRCRGTPGSASVGPTRRRSARSHRERVVARDRARDVSGTVGRQREASYSV